MAPLNPLSLQLTLVGTNHERARIDVRERLWCRPETVPDRLKSLIHAGMREAVILSTCNRTEIYALTNPGLETLPDLKEALSRWSSIGLADLERNLYALTDEEAVRHLISVAAGLDSLAVGERQIQDQVRQALRLANRAGTSGRFLFELFKHADKAADDIRNRSGLASEEISVGSAVTRLLKRLVSEHTIRTILLIGSGKMISLAAGDLAGLPGVNIWVANRTPEKAKALATRVGGKAIALGDVGEAVQKSDVVVTCTSASDYVLRTEELKKAIVGRRDNGLIVIDISVPRNVDPDAKLIPGIRLYDIDDLVPLGEAQAQSLKPKLEHAKRLVGEQARNFLALERAYEANDLLRDLRRVAEDIREKELSRALRKLGDVPNREKTILELLTRRIVNKLLYEPTLRLKEHATNGDGEHYETVIRELFDIGRQSEP